MNWYLASPNSAGRGWPSSLFKSGLGSNVSKWLGPPAMNRKITARAFAPLWCAGLGARGLGPLARTCSSCSSDSNARAPKPPKASRRNSRRVAVGRTWWNISIVSPSVHVQEGVQIKNRQRKLGERLLAEELDCQRLLLLGRRPANCDEIGTFNLADRIRPGFAEQALCKSGRKFVCQPAVEQLQGLRCMGARFPTSAAGLGVRLVEHFEERQPNVPLRQQINGPARVFR